MSSGWLEGVLVNAKAARLCMDAHCTTCGCLRFRESYWVEAARQANLARRTENPRQGFDLLAGWSAEERQVLAGTLIAGLRDLPPEWTRSKAFETLIIDLDPPIFLHGLLIGLEAALAGTPAAAAYENLRARGSRSSGVSNKESPAAVEERRRLKREKRAAAHADRVSAKRQHDIERNSILAVVARLRPAERLSKFAVDESLRLDRVSDDLIPTHAEELIGFDRIQAAILIARIGRRPGAWRRLSKQLTDYLSK